MTTATPVILGNVVLSNGNLAVLAGNQIKSGNYYGFDDLQVAILSNSTPFTLNQSTGNLSFASAGDSPNGSFSGDTGLGDSTTGGGTIAALPGGGMAVMTWGDSNLNYDLQILNNAGTVTAAPFVVHSQVTTPGNNALEAGNPQGAVAAWSGGLVVAYTTDDQSKDYFQRYTLAGVAVGAPVEFASTSDGSGTGWYGSMAVDSSGDVIFGFGAQDIYTPGAYKMYSSANVLLNTPDNVGKDAANGATAVAGQDYAPLFAPLPGGGFATVNYTSVGTYDATDGWFPSLTMNIQTVSTGGAITTQATVPHAVEDNYYQGAYVNWIAALPDGTVEFQEIRDNSYYHDANLADSYTVAGGLNRGGVTLPLPSDGNTPFYLPPAVGPGGNLVGLTLNSSNQLLSVAAVTAPSITGISPDTGTSSADRITDTGALTVNGTATAGTSIALFNGATQIGSTTTGSGGAWSIVLGTALGQGSYSLTATASSGGTTSSSSTGFAVTVDTTPPSVTSDNLVGSSPNHASSDAFTVTFSESVAGVSTSSFQLTDTGTAAGTIASVSGSGSTYTVTVTGVTGDGTMRLDLKSSGAGITDAAGNAASGGYTSGQVYSIEHTPPAVSSVGVPANATYIAGQNLDFTLNFSEAVTVTGTPEIALTLDAGGTVDAQYISDSGSSALTFRYTVIGGEADTNGVSLGSAITLNSGAISDAAGNNAVLALNNVASTSSVLVDSIAPTVSSVTAPSNGTYGAGQSLAFTVNFSENVLVTGTPYLTVTLDNGGAVQAAYTGGSGSSALTFAYTVVSGNEDMNGVAVGSAITLNGGAIKDAATNAAVPTLNSVASTSNVLVDAIPPTVLSIDTVESSPNNLTSEDFTVSFSAPVTGVDASDFTVVGAGTASGVIAAVSGSGTTWTVTVGSVAGDGTLRLDLNNAGDAITDSFGNTLTAAHTGDQVYTIEHTPPSVTAMTVPADGAYAAGQSLDFTTTFSEAVNVDTTGGTPRLALTLDTGGTVYADYVSGSSTNTLTFQYTVVAGEQDLTGIATGSSIDVNGGSIKDAATNDAVLTLTGEPSTAGVDVDAIAPAVLSVAVPSNGTYGTGQYLDFTVDFSKVVTVNTGGGTPYIDLTLDTGGTVQAAYLSGSATSALVFRYVVASGEIDTNGVSVGATVVLNGGAIQDAVGNNAAPALDNVASTAGVLVDSILPTVTSIDTAEASTNNLTTETFTVTFSADVSLSPPDITDFTLHTTGSVGGTVASVTASGSTYAVTVTGVTGDGTMRLDLNTSGSTITDSFGNPVTATHIGDQTYTIQHTPPSPTAMTAPANGVYGVGQTLDFTTTFSEAVTVTGAPRLALTLDTGGTVYADYIAGSGANTLTFEYTVLAGEQDLTGIATATSIDANGGTIEDAAGNAAVLAVNAVVPSTAGIDIDAISPVVTSVGVPSNATYIAGQDLDFTVNLDKAVTVDTSGGTPYITLTLDTGGTVNAEYISGSGTSSLTFRYVVAPGNLDGDGVTLGAAIVLNGATIDDAHNNPASQPLTGVASTSGVQVDAVAPTVSSITTLGSSLNNSGSEQFSITFSESVTGVTAAAFSLHDTGAVSGTIAAVSGSGASYTVTVSNVIGDGTMRLDVNASGTGIADLATNPLSGGFTSGQTYTLDHTPPVATAVNISVTGGSGAGGAFRIGDVVTASWNDSATGDDNADTAGVTFDFSQFGGGSAVVARDSGGDWTATYTIAAGGIDTTSAHIATTVTDAAGNVTTAAGGPVAVNDVAVAPTITGAAAGQTTTSEATLKPFANVTIGDDNPGATETLTITLSGSGGLLSGAGLTGSGGGYTLSGTAPAVTAELEALLFTATPGAPGTSGTTTFTLSDTSSVFATPTVNFVTTVTDVDPSGTGWGDVHMVTFQGLHYDFQAVGDFTLVKGTTSADPFDVQIRTSSWASMISVTTEIAAQVGGNAVQFDLDGTVKLNGAVDTSLGWIDAVQKIDGGTITRTSANSYVVDWASGESLAVTNAGAYFNETVTLSAKDGPGSVQGLLGSNTSQATDIQLANGAVLNAPTDSQLLGVYAESWSVADSASLLNDNTSLPLAMSNDGNAATPFNGKSFIDLAGLNPANATVGFQEDASGAFGALSIQNGAQQTSMTLLGQYAAAGFGIASDGHGGTIVDYTPPKVSMLG